MKSFDIDPTELAKLPRSRLTAKGLLIVEYRDGATVYYPPFSPYGYEAAEAGGKRPFPEMASVVGGWLIFYPFQTLTHLGSSEKLLNSLLVVPSLIAIFSLASIVSPLLFGFRISEHRLTPNQLLDLRFLCSRSVQKSHWLVRTLAGLVLLVALIFIVVREPSTVGVLAGIVFLGVWFLTRWVTANRRLREARSTIFQLDLNGPTKPPIMMAANYG